jgi:hypothetical protein
MPTGFLSHLTAALLAMHTVLGCCSHHEHACGQGCDSTASVESSDIHSEHSDDTCGASNSESHGNHGPHHCQGSTCAFVCPAREAAFSDAFHFDLPSFACAAHADSLAQVASDSWPHFTADALLPPLRLHLSHQVLLL